MSSSSLCLNTHMYTPCIPLHTYRHLYTHVHTNYHQAELSTLRRQHDTLLAESDVLERQVTNLKELLSQTTHACQTQHIGTQGAHNGVWDGQVKLINDVVNGMVNGMIMGVVNITVNIPRMTQEMLCCRAGSPCKHWTPMHSGRQQPRVRTHMVKPHRSKHNTWGNDWGSNHQWKLHKQMQQHFPLFLHSLVLVNKTVNSMTVIHCGRSKGPTQEPPCTWIHCSCANRPVASHA